ncbi:MAG: flagellar basal body L-ring protein FlgH [Candidatus Gastranaerophilales bacterium]|nr:flagellar basal body L-ring protein FlgH [Candidatus Gastranaerophilales bacterium]
MKKLGAKILISILIVGIATPVYAESLFRTGISQNAYPIQPRPLFSSVRAKSIGDLVTIIIKEETKTKDDLQFDTSKSSSTVDNFSTLVNKVLPGNPINKELGNYGGSNDVSSQTQVQRTTSIEDTITAQVVQILPNGNLLVQGKKATINSGENVNLIISGIIDPRLLDNTGSISSKLVANLQMAFSGQGNVSRSNSEGPLNKLIRFLF